jgi:hypothetical protein
LFWVADLSASLKALIYFGCHAKSSFSQRKTIKQRNNKRLKNKNKKDYYTKVRFEKKKNLGRLNFTRIWIALRE